MGARRTTVAATLAALAAASIGIATTHAAGGTAAKRPAAIPKPHLIAGLVKTHVCHPGRKGSMRDALD